MIAQAVEQLEHAPAGYPRPLRRLQSSSSNGSWSRSQCTEARAFAALGALIALLVASIVVAAGAKRCIGAREPAAAVTGADMTSGKGLRIGGGLLVVAGFAFLVSGYSSAEQSLYGAAAALICVGCLLISLAGNPKHDA